MYVAVHDDRLVTIAPEKDHLCRSWLSGTTGVRLKLHLDMALLHQEQERC
jgi:hypothetical protein